MLKVLDRAIGQLGVLLDKPDNWKSLYIDYHPPLVERLWTIFEDDYRIYLHRIHPCEDAAQTLYHPHPWPSAMLIVDGEYEMGIGYMDTETRGGVPRSRRLPLRLFYDPARFTKWLTKMLGITCDLLGSQPIAS